MKNILFILLLISTSIFAQQNDKKWEKVIDFENEGKTKSADELVEKIYKNAVSDKDEAEIIKCFFYRSKYLLIVDESAQNKILNNLKTEISRVSIPSKAILNLVYAKCLNDYYNQNKYYINSRTNTTTLNDDFLTWTGINFRTQIDLALKQSLENELVLKNTSLSKYEQIFDYSTLEEFKNQDLFSYIIKENIGIYSSKIYHGYDQNEFAAYKNVLLGNSVDFIKLNLDFVNNEDLHAALLLYQKQETIHPTQDNQWDRLQFLKTIQLISDEDFFETLLRFQKTVKEEFLTQKIQLQKALIIAQQASKENHPDYNIKAVAILDSIIKINNRSNAYKKAIQSKTNIQAKSLNIQLEKYTYNDQNSRAFISYKNIDHLKVSFYKINQKQIIQFKEGELDRDSLVNAIILKMPQLYTKDYPLVNKKDYFEYTTEILLPNLKTGSYLVYFESESDIKDTKAYTYEIVTSSNISVLASYENKNEKYQVLDRKTGEPLENVTIKSEKFKIKTGKNGIAVYSSEDEKFNREPLELYTKNDTILIKEQYINYNTKYSDKDIDDENKSFDGKVEFYLDRAIYRPGQIVYFKGIAIQKKKNKTSVVPQTSFKIIIQDPSYNNFKEIEVKTNDFGSFSGEFVLPKTGLTGNFRITAQESLTAEQDIIYNKKEADHPFWDHVSLQSAYTDFRVEEYKRPKFEVTFEPKKESFQVNQTIKIKGNANAFAGSSISDAKITYTITRYTTYNIWRNYSDFDANEILVTGETKTDASGKFVIDFVAKPSENSSKEQLPIFNYAIEAIVTDINGESHEARTNIKVGYHDLVLETVINREIQTKDKNEIILKSSNLNDEFLAAKGEVKIYFVRPFPNKFKRRVFQKPEIQTISNEEFEKLFPYEQNDQEVNEKEVLVYSKKVDTEKDKKIALDFISNYKSGTYKIVFAAKDSFNNNIEYSTNFKITQSNDKFDPSALFTAKQINEDPKKDGFILVKLTSVIPELYVSTIGNYESKIFFEKTIHLENNEAIVKIPLKNEFQNSIKIGFQSIFENEGFSSEINVTLKSITPKLDFTVETFRSKLQPGSSENWSFKLKSTDTTKEAEVLASMYDSSLDQFTTRDWYTLAINSYNSNYSNKKSILGFGESTASMMYLNMPLNRIDLFNEDTKLMYFGFDFNTKNSPYSQRQYQMQLAKKAKKPFNSKTINGIVKDESGLPLPGVSIVVKGTQRGTQSDFDGYYEIAATEKEQLVFSYIGSKSQTIKVENRKFIDVVLTNDARTLESVVVTANGILKEKKMLAYATATVSQESLVKDDFSNNLKGKISGVTIVRDSLSPEYYFRTHKISFFPGQKVVNGLTSVVINSSTLYIIDGQTSSEENFKNINPNDILDIDFLTSEKASALYGKKAANGAVIITTQSALDALNQVKARKNLSETAFFLPNLKTDSKGKVSFNFTTPEALTAWKLRLLAHNKEAISGYLQKSVVTQKELMLLPNFPRFFREKDTIVISTKISNVTPEAKTGIAVLQFFDAVTMEPIDAKMLNTNNIRNFTIPAFGNTSANWTITIPEGLEGVQYKILAKSGDFSDGEENIIPVLTNNMLVTESIPVWVRENSTKEYTFENLKNNNSTTLRNHQFTFEYTSNPTWIAIQSLPYLIEFEHECAEQTFSRFYANSLATEIISSNPKIAALFEDWRKNGKPISKLEENEDLKSIILSETPWLRDAQNEDERKKNLALLFDLEKMKTSQEATFEKLKKKQNPSGGFSWFDGGYYNGFITRHILAGLGHLDKLINTKETKINIAEITKKGVPYIDHLFLEEYKSNEKYHKKANQIWPRSYSNLHYLYTRSFYLDQYPLSDTFKKTTKLYLETPKKEWLNYSLYEKGLTALILNRFGEKETARKIIESLKETSSNNEDWGMYWIANKAGWYWYQAPIETQALLIEAFAEVNNDTKSVDAMKVWLLKNKQAKNWPTTKSTSEAIYALLLQGTDWLSVKDNTIIKLGDEKIMTKKLAENQKEAETGYIKLNWKGDEVKKEMASISIQNKSKVPGFGGVYWQYFEDLDKIKNNSGAVLSVSKELYLKKSTLKGDELERITSKNPLKTGDLVTVRLIITAKEDTEYIHLKDMRASCFEPVNVLSEYQYKDRLGYYMSTKDAATHFFFDQINKGTYVLEYEIRVNNSGEFSNGITTIQSMYAPEFASHTKGIRVKVN